MCPYLWFFTYLYLRNVSIYKNKSQYNFFENSKFHIYLCIFSIIIATNGAVVPEMYLGPSRTSKMELFAKIANSF